MTSELESTERMIENVIWDKSTARRDRCDIRFVQDGKLEPWDFVMRVSNKDIERVRKKLGDRLDEKPLDSFCQSYGELLKEFSFTMGSLDSRFRLGHTLFRNKLLSMFTQAGVVVPEGLANWMPQASLNFELLMRNREGILLATSLEEQVIAKAKENSIECLGAQLGARRAQDLVALLIKYQLWNLD